MSDKRIEFVDREYQEIGSNESVKVKTCKNDITITKLDKAIPLSQYRQVGGGKHIKILKNGRTTKPKKNKAKKLQNQDGTFMSRGITSVKRSYALQREIVELNFFGNPLNEFHVVLKYRKPNQDMFKALTDCKKLIDKLQRRFKGQKLVYIGKPELHEKLGWHLHLLIQFSDMELTKAKVEKIMDEWEHGNVSVDEVYDVSGLKHYLFDTAKPKKSYNKRERKIKSYDNYITAQRIPAGRRKIYVSSQGMEKPKIERKTLKEAEGEIKNKKIVKTQSQDIISRVKGEKVNGYTREIYN